MTIHAGTSRAQSLMSPKRTKSVMQLPLVLNTEGGTNREGYHSIPIATSHRWGKNAHTRYMTYATKLPMYSTNPCDSTVGAGSVGSRGGNWAGKEDEERSIGAEVISRSGSDLVSRGRADVVVVPWWRRLRDEVERETEGEAGRESDWRTGRNRALAAGIIRSSQLFFEQAWMSFLQRKTHAKASGLEGRIGLP